MFKKRMDGQGTQQQAANSGLAKKPPSWIAFVLALALTSVFFSLWRGNARMDVQGPIALAIETDGSSWLAINQSIWHIDPQGRRIKELTGPGPKQRASQLILRPSGALWAVIQGDDQIYALNQQNWAPVLRLQWPADLIKHGTGAQKVALAPDGQIAVATGGGHFVALFAADGSYIARTAPNTYRYTNGLWFADQALWTTDTNNGQLVKLELPSMKVLERLSLQPLQGARRFLGNAAPWPIPSQAAGKNTLAALIVFDNNMITGHAAAIDSTGNARSFPGPSDMEPLDVAWHEMSKSWWIVDSSNFQIRRWASDGKALDPAFSPDVRQQLSSILRQRQLINWQYYGGLAAGIGLLAIALTGLGVHKYGEQKKLTHTITLKLGTIQLSEWELAKLQLKNLVYLWPMFFLLAALQIMPLEASRNLILQAKALAPSAFWMALIFAYALITVWLLKRQTKRLASDPALESLANIQAIRLIKRNINAIELASGETPLEAAWFHPGLRPSLLIMTNQGLIFLRMEGMGRLRRYLSIPWRYVTQLDFDGQQKLHIKAENAQKQKEWRGKVPHQALAKRMYALAQNARESAQFDSFELRTSVGKIDHLAMPILAPHKAATASTLFPGLGQWLQRRNDDALVHFVMAAPMLCFLVFLVWVNSVPMTDLQPGMLITVALAYAVIVIFSASEAFSYARSQILNAQMNHGNPNQPPPGV